MSQSKILSALTRGPRTAFQLAETICDSSGSVARTCNKLMRDGRIARIDGGSGRGSKAVYALAEREVAAG